MLEKSVSEVIKVKDIDVNCEEFVKNKYEEQCNLIDTDVRNVFVSCSVIKCIAGLNHYGEMIKSIDKSIATAS